MAKYSVKETPCATHRSAIIIGQSTNSYYHLIFFWFLALSDFLDWHWIVLCLKGALSHVKPQLGERQSNGKHFVEILRRYCMETCPSLTWGLNLGNLHQRNFLFEICYHKHDNCSHKTVEIQIILLCNSLYRGGVLSWGIGPWLGLSWRRANWTVRKASPWSPPGLSLCGPPFSLLPSSSYSYPHVVIFFFCLSLSSLHLMKSP